VSSNRNHHRIRRDKGDEVSRREFIGGISRLAAGIAIAQGSPVIRAQQAPITTPNSPFSRAFDFAALKEFITPNNEFFVRSHFGLPRIERSRWNMTISGVEGRPRVFSMDELTRLPALELVVTLECAGNLVGWGGVSNARWIGVRLRSLLQGVNLRGGVDVVLLGADGGSDREAGGVSVDAYARSIPLAKALDPNTIVAYRMNGEALPDSHGGPLRAIVPGWYGMDSVKWLNKIIVSREPFKGFYQTQRYYEARRVNGATERGPLGPVRLKSQFARPIQGAVLPLKPVTVTGAAWCGDAEIAAVDLSFDGGRSWTPARLADDRAPFAWRLWSYEWKPDRVGQYEIIARARDERGRVQPLAADPNIITPYANNRADRRVVEVR
jgi:DMSO/TMAO reductase YedYZ molybdopterin-dependent catalytic subunit